MLSNNKPKYVPPHRRGMHPFAEAFRSNNRKGNKAGRKEVITRLNKMIRDNRRLENYGKNQNERGSSIEEKAHKLLTDAGSYMIPANNLYTYAIHNPNAPQISTIIDKVYDYMYSTQPITDQPRNPDGSAQLFNFNFVDEKYHTDPEVQKLMQMYNGQPEDIDSVKRCVNLRSCLADAHRRVQRVAVDPHPELEPLYKKIVELEETQGLIFSTPAHTNEQFVKELYDYLGLPSPYPEPSLVKKLDIRYQLDNILKHGIQKGEDGDYIGFVTKDNFSRKLEEYQKIRGTYDPTKSPLNVANEERMGSNDNEGTSRNCDLDELPPDQLLLEFVDPTNEYILKEKMNEINEAISENNKEKVNELLKGVVLPYNRRQFVYGFQDENKLYNKCNKFFRRLRKYTHEHIDKYKEGYSYSRLLNKYFVMKSASTKMLFPIRFVLPNKFEFKKHKISVDFIEYLTNYKFIGVIEFKYLQDKLIKEYILIFQSSYSERDKASGGIYTSIHLLNFRLLPVGFGDLDYLKNITYDELRVMMHMGVKFYKLKKQFPNNIIFGLSLQYDHSDIPKNIADQLIEINYKDSMIDDIISRRYTDGVDMLYGGGKFSTDMLFQLYKKQYSYDILTFREFLFTLFPYIYIDSQQYSGLIVNTTLKYRNYYLLDKIVKCNNYITNEMLNKFNISTNNKTIVEVNNYFPTSITNIDNNKDLHLLLYPNIPYYSLDISSLHGSKLESYFKKINTQIHQQFLVKAFNKKIDLIFFNLTYFLRRDDQQQNEKDNLPLRKKMIKFVELNLKPGGTLIFNIGYINLPETRRIVLKLQSLFSSVELYRPEIQHVFKQSGLALIAKGFKKQNKKPKYTMKSLEQMNDNIHLDKFKFYYDLFPFYHRFINCDKTIKIIDSQKRYQLLMSYLYAKQWKLKFSVSIDKPFIMKLKQNLHELFHKKPFRFSFKQLKQYYIRFKKKIYIKKLDWDTVYYGTVQDKIDINNRFAELHNYQTPNMITKHFRFLTCGEQYYLTSDLDNLVQQIWELFIRYPEIVIHRPTNISEPNSFHIQCKGERDDKVKIPNSYDKFFAEKIVEIIKQFTDLYAERLTYEVNLLKYPTYLKLLL